jgi:hypothetical protein
MTVHYWGEKVSFGNAKWQVLVSNAGDKNVVFKNWKITFYGTRTDPQPGLKFAMELEKFKQSIKK